MGNLRMLKNNRKLNDLDYILVQVSIFKLVTKNIPTDLRAPAFRQGDTFGEHQKFWFQAMFFRQYRLFSASTGAPR